MAHAFARKDAYDITVCILTAANLLEKRLLEVKICRKTQDYCKFLDALKERLTLSRLAITWSSPRTAACTVGLFEAAVPSVYSAAATRLASDSPLIMLARTAVPPNFGKSAPKHPDVLMVWQQDSLSACDSSVHGQANFFRCYEMLEIMHIQAKRLPIALSMGSTKYRRAVRASTRKLTALDAFFATASASSISSLSVGSAPISATNYTACVSVCAHQKLYEQ